MFSFFYNLFTCCNLGFSAVKNTKIHHFTPFRRSFYTNSFNLRIGGDRKYFSFNTNSKNFYDFSNSVFSSLRTFLDTSTLPQDEKQLMIEEFLNLQYKQFLDNKTSYKPLGIDINNISKPIKDLLFFSFKDDFVKYINKYLHSNKDLPISDKNRRFHYEVLSSVNLEDLFSSVLFCFFYLVRSTASHKVQDLENKVESVSFTIKLGKEVYKLYKFQAYKDFSSKNPSSKLSFKD